MKSPWAATAMAAITLLLGACTHDKAVPFEEVRPVRT